MNNALFLPTDASLSPGTGDKLIILQTNEANVEKPLPLSLFLHVLPYLSVLSILYWYIIYIHPAKQIIRQTYQGEVEREAVKLRK